MSKHLYNFKMSQLNISWSTPQKKRLGKIVISIINISLYESLKSYLMNDVKIITSSPLILNVYRRMFKMIIFKKSEG